MKPPTLELAGLDRFREDVDEIGDARIPEAERLSAVDVGDGAARNRTAVELEDSASSSARPVVVRDSSA